MKRLPIAKTDLRKIVVEIEFEEKQKNISLFK